MTAALATHDPAVAIAMGRCLTARALEPETRCTDRHPRGCGWCDYPASELKAAVEEFTAWAGFNDRQRTTERHATRTWSELGRDEQERRIEAAQELGNELWHVPPAPTELPGERLAGARPTPTPADEALAPETNNEEVPEWAR